MPVDQPTSRGVRYRKLRTFVVRTMTQRNPIARRAALLPHDASRRQAIAHGDAL
jgi:hypothetical protein